MPKPTKKELAKYRKLLLQHLANLSGDVGSLRDEALRASEQDASVDHLADQGTDNYDQGFLLGLIENEEETIGLIQEALERIDGKSDVPYGRCLYCYEQPELCKKKPAKGKKVDPWIPKERLEYIPWARYCVESQAAMEEGREIA